MKDDFDFSVTNSSASSPSLPQVAIFDLSAPSYTQLTSSPPSAPPSWNQTSAPGFSSPNFDKHIENSPGTFFKCAPPVGLRLSPILGMRPSPPPSLPRIHEIAKKNNQSTDFEIYSSSDGFGSENTITVPKAFRGPGDISDRSISDTDSDDDEQARLEAVQSATFDMLKQLECEYKADARLIIAAAETSIRHAESETAFESAIVSNNSNLGIRQERVGRKSALSRLKQYLGDVKHPQDSDTEFSEYHDSESEERKQRRFPVRKRFKQQLAPEIQSSHPQECQSKIPANQPELLFVDQQPSSIRTCSNPSCKTTEAKAWRFLHADTERQRPLCSPCKLYWDANGRNRPRHLVEQPRKIMRLKHISAEKRKCSNCGVKETPLWRFVENKLCCNACAQYWNKHKKKKPVGGRE